MSKFLPKILFNSNVKLSVNFQQTRTFPRWAHRRPLRVLPSLEEQEKANTVQNHKNIYEESVESDKTGPKIKWRTPLQEKSNINKKYSLINENIDKGAVQYKIKPADPLTISTSGLKKAKAKKVESFDILETIIDGNGDLVYTKMKNNDSRISHIMVDLKSKKDKDKDRILLEGKRLIRDALQQNCKLEYILFSRKDDIEELKPYLPKMGAKLYKMPYREMGLWSDLTTTPGIMGVFKTPKVEEYQVADPLPLTIICDNIREPNNLGAVLRICSGVSCEKVFLSKGCVNLWDTKVLRSASGAHFHLQIHKKMDWTTIKTNLSNNNDLSLFLADNRIISETAHNLNVVPYYAVDFKELNSRSAHIVLILGGETEGISEEAYEMCSELQGVRLNIPLGNGVDSLNVATAVGIITFEIKRQLSLV